MMWWVGDPAVQFRSPKGPGHFGLLLAALNLDNPPMDCRRVAVVALVSVVAMSPWPASGGGTITDVNLTAGLLAGNRVPGARSITRGKAWRTHRSAMERAWSSYERSTLDPMRVWGRREVAPHLARGGVVRYPFSGPDVLHVLRMFPDARTYVLCGLEPVGSPPRSAVLRGRGAGGAFTEIRKILEESIRFSFFKTKDMRVELADATYRGTLPIMCLFLARSGFEITGIEFLELGKGGGVRVLGGGRDTADAVRIDARGRGGTKSFYYFRTNIADGSISRSGFLAFSRSLPPGGSYLKAASYLMHRSYFSQIRDHLLASSTVLVQDDSGIPIRHFEPSAWRLAFYGAYSAPIPLFGEHYQEELRRAYRNRSEPLPFGIGYRWQKGDSNLLVAVRSRGVRAPRAVAVMRKTPPPLRGAGWGSPPETGGVVSGGRALDLTMRLVARSQIDAFAELRGRSAFVVNEYEILAVHRGPQSFRGRRIRVATTSLLNGRRLPARPLGSEITIRVRPLSAYPALMKWHLEDDLPESGDAVLYIADQS